MAKRDERIKTVRLKSGAVRYEFCTVVVAQDGSRKQQRQRFEKLADAERELAALTAGRHEGRPMARWDGSVRDVIGEFLASNAVQRLEAGSRANYHLVLMPVLDRMGSRKARTVTRQDIDQLLAWMLASGRRSGGATGTPLSAWTVKATLGRLRQAFDMACRDHGLPYNPAQYAEVPAKLKSRPKNTWTPGEIDTFVGSDAVISHRLHALLRLSSLGLRREEILGARWDRLTFTPGDEFAGVLMIAEDDSARVHVYFPEERTTRSVIKEPKSAHSVRPVYLDAQDVAALKALKARQAREALKAGPAYQQTGLIAVDELGAPLNVRWYSRQFERLAAAAGLPPMTLHGLRRSLNTEQSIRGTSTGVRAAGLGHTQQVNTSASYSPATDEHARAFRRGVAASRASS